MMDNRRQNKEHSEWEDRVVNLRRVSKVTRGGRHFRFSAVVVVGDKQGRVGLGYGKANELTDSVRKAKNKAIKAAKKINLKGTTIPHEVIGKFKASEIMIKPAFSGTGVIAGGSVRAVLELVGIKDVLTKSLRSTNPINSVKATISGLEHLYDIKEVANKRRKSVQDIFFPKF